MPTINQLCLKKIRQKKAFKNKTPALEKILKKKQYV
jgi:hypothetical protein